MTKLLGSLLGHPAETLVYQANTNLVLPTCRLGLEFEFEGVRNLAAKGIVLMRDRAAQYNEYWNVKADGSLHDNGAEFVFRAPLFGADITKALDTLLKDAAENKWKISKRTGLHVHVDVRDLTRKAYETHNTLFALFEPAIYRWVGDDRDDNPHCIPWYRAGAALRNLSDVQNADNEDFRPLLRNMRRYSGLNLNATAEFGSVEWRQMLTTVNRRRIDDWLAIVMRFKEAATRYADHSWSDILRELSSRGARNFARDVLREQMDILDYAAIGDDIMSVGVQTAQDLALLATIKPKKTRSWDVWDTTSKHKGFAKFKEGLSPKKEQAGQPAVAQQYENGLRGLYAEVVAQPPDPVPGRGIIEVDEWDRIMTRARDMNIVLNRAPVPPRRRDR